MPGPRANRAQYTPGSPASKRRAKRTTVVPAKGTDQQVVAVTTTQPNAKRIRKTNRARRELLARYERQRNPSFRGDNKADLKEIYENQRARRVNALAESGVIEHPNKPHNFESFVGDLIPDTPAEVGLEVIPGGLALRAAGKPAAKVATKVLAKTAKGAGAKEGAKVVEKAGAKALAKKAIKKAPEPVKTAAKKAKVKVATPVKKAGATKAGSVAKTAGRGTRTAARVGKRNAGKITFGAPFAAQAPLALTKGDPGEFKKAVSGEGVFAKGAHGAGHAADTALPGIAGNAARDLISLPADVLPSTYFAGKAAYKAAQGHPEEAQALWEDYKKHGFLPKIVTGDLKGAAHNFGEHPLYSTLEASGAYAAAGRGAGALARRTPIKAVKKAGSTARPDKKVYGRVNKKQDYSANIITKAAQKSSERRKARRGEDPFRAAPKERQRYLKKAVDDFEGAMEGRRRSLRDEAIRDIQKKRPGKHRPIQKADREVVTEVAQGLIRSKDRWREDIDLRIAQLKANERKPGTMTRAERKSNRQQIEALEHARGIEDPKRIDAIFEAADAYKGKMKGNQADLVEAGLLDEAQAKKAAAIPFARTHMGADYEHGVGVIDRNGKPLPLEKIQAEMKRQGVSEPAFLSHRQGWRGKGSFYQPWSAGRSGSAEKARTGSATTKGSYDATWDAAVEQIASATTKANRAKTFDDFISRFAVRPKGGYFKDFAEARDATINPDRYRIDTGGVDMVPVRLVAPGKKASELASAKRRGDPVEMDRLLSPDADPDVILSDMLAVAEKDVGDGPVVLVPKQVMDRFREHSKPAGTTMRAAQAINSAFKSTVLPLSPRWVYGNMIEPFVRSVISGLTPVDYVAGKRLARAAKEADPEIFRDFEQRTLGGTLFGATDRQRIHRDASQFIDTNVGPLASALVTFAKAPGIRQLTHLYRSYRDAVFAINSRLFERQPQYAALGKAARKDVQQTTDSWTKSLWLGEKALGDLAKGLKETDNQLKYADSVAQVFGNWYRFGPDARAAMMSYAPFFGWARASGSLVFYTLPRHHPIKTGIIAALERATQDEREAYGAARTGKMPLPGNLQGSLPGGIPHVPFTKEDGLGSTGGIVPISGLSSFGAWSDPITAPTNFILPQMSSILDALHGLDWKGDRLEDQYGRPLDEQGRILAAAKAFGEAMLPPVALTMRVAQADSVGDYFKPVRPIDVGTVDYIRRLSNKQKISVNLSKEKQRAIKASK